MKNSMNVSQDKALAMYTNGALGDITSFNEVSSAGNAGGTSDLILGNCDIWPYYETYHHYYPFPTVITPNKTETAYKVVKVLIDKKLANVTTVKQLVTLIDAIVEVV